MIKIIRRSFNIAVTLVAASILLPIVFSALGAETNTIVKIMSFLFLISFISALFTNYFLMKVGKIGMANIVIWCFGALIMGPISYFFMLYLLGSTIEEFAREQRA